MKRLRKFLFGSFPFITAVFAMAAVGTVPALIRPLARDEFRTPYWAKTHSQQLLAVVLLVLARLIFAIPLVITALYGMSWWTIWKRKPSARRWVIAASVAMAVQTIPGWFLIAVASTHSRSEIPALIWVLNSVGSALGVAGLVAFWPRNALETPVYPVKQPKISGDGTNPLLDGAFWVVQIGGYYAGITLWYRWADGQDLFVSYGLQMWEFFGVALMAAIVFHEMGHAVTGLLLGMKLRSLHAGPFQWYVDDGRWKFRFNLAGLFYLSGSAGVVPVSAMQAQWREICMIAAGPVVNLLTGAIACIAVFNAPGHSYEEYWQLLAEFSALSLVIFASNLIPARPQVGYSDGARIYQAMRGGPLTDLYRVFTLAAATQVSHVRPRDYDITAIQRATPVFTEGYQAVILRLIESEYFLDNGNLKDAIQPFVAAETICESSAPNFPVFQYSLFVFGNAYLRRDAAAARRWWERMTAKDPKRFNTDYWLAKCSLHWIEGSPTEALDAWERGNAIATAIEMADFDRYRFVLMRTEIERSGSNGTDCTD